MKRCLPSAKSSVNSGFGERVYQFITGESSMIGDGPIGSLKLHERKRSQRGPKHPRRTLVGERLGSWTEGQGPIGSLLGKELIESGMR